MLLTKFAFVFGIISFALSMHLDAEYNANLVTEVKNICAEDIRVEIKLNRISRLDDFEAVPAIIYCKDTEVCKLLLKKATTYPNANKKACDLVGVIEHSYYSQLSRQGYDTVSNREKIRLCLCELAGSGWDAVKPQNRRKAVKKLLTTLQCPVCLG